MDEKMRGPGNEVADEKSSAAPQFSRCYICLFKESLDCKNETRQGKRTQVWPFYRFSGCGISEKMLTGYITFGRKIYGYGIIRLRKLIRKIAYFEIRINSGIATGFSDPPLPSLLELIGLPMMRKLPFSYSTTISQFLTSRLKFLPRSCLECIYGPTLKVR